MMPRDLSGNYSRVIPPGASGYQANTDILSAQVNGEMNDIGNELTKSLAKDGTTAPTNNLPMANFVHTGMGQADAVGESLRYEALGKGSDIAVTANGTVALPFEGSLFNLTAAAAFNVTGFTGRHDGRPFCVRFNPDKLLTLVNSATFKLLGGSNRIARAGEIVHFVQESAGIITEVGQQPLIDLTGYSGADVALGVGQSAIYDVTTATTLLLRIATVPGRYAISGDFAAAASSNVGGVTLLPNNAAIANVILNTVAFLGPPTNVVSQSTTLALTSYTFAASNSTTYSFDVVVSTFTNAKNGETTKNTRSTSAVEARETIISNYWNDLVTAHTSLGTLSFGNTGGVTGKVTVKRLI